MSSVQNVVDYFETEIPLAVAGIKKSQHYYNNNNNDSRGINNTFSVRPGIATPVSGVLGNATFEQTFTIEITKNYVDQSSNDLKLREIIESIYLDHQEIGKQVSLRRRSPILLIGVPTKEAPVVDEQKKFVSIIFTYPVRYRELVRSP